MEDFSIVPRVAAACCDGFPSPSTAARYPHPRIRYRLSHFVVDAASSWARLLYPGMSSEWVAAAHAMEHAACEVGEVEGAAFALVALDAAAFAVTYNVEVAAAGAHGAIGRERVADFADVQLLPRASCRWLPAMLHLCLRLGVESSTAGCLADGPECARRAGTVWPRRCRQIG